MIQWAGKDKGELVSVFLSRDEQTWRSCGKVYYLSCAQVNASMIARCRRRGHAGTPCVVAVALACSNSVVAVHV